MPDAPCPTSSRDNLNTKIAQSITRMDKWLPSIRKRAEDLGLHSYKELWQRVEHVTARYPDFFGTLSYFETSLVVQGDISHIFLRTSNDYRHTAYAVAMALDMRAEDLFGPVAEAQKVGKPLTEDGIQKIHERYDTLKQEYNLSTATTPLTICLSRDFQQAIQAEIMRKLTPIQQSVLGAYYGFNAPPKTQQEIANEHNLSRERISQIHLQSLRLLSKSNVVKEFHRPL